MQENKNSDPFGKIKNKHSNRSSKNQDADLNSSDGESQQQTPQTQQPQEPEVQFKDNPIQMKCPFCLQNVRTEIILKPEFISILLGFALFVMLPNFIMLIFTLIILQVTSTRKHRCPMCERELGSDGTNGIIISKKIIASIVIGAAVLILLSIKVNNAYADATFTDMTWPEFSSKCPYESTEQRCQYGNEGFTVKNWRGYVMRVQDNRNTIKRHFQYAVSVYIKMNDPQSMNKYKERPDLFLTITSFQAHEWQDSLNKITHGDEIEFNATFQYLRNTRNIPVGRHLNIIEFNFTGKHNPDIHVYMSEVEDSWFFQNLSGEKLRKHEEDAEEKGEINEQKFVEKEVEKELSRDIEAPVNPTQKQKQVIGDVNG